MSDPTGRFADRVADYVRARPSYPSELVTALVSRCGLLPSWRVADVGCGPGNLARLFLDHGNPVLGVEPNAEMREAGRRALAVYPEFEMIDGRAEATGLPPDSVDLVAAAQAFHWFEPRATRREFARILAPDGRVALIWNDRDEQRSQFMEGYEELLRRHGTDYHRVHHRRVSESDLAAFYAPAGFERIDLEHEHRLDRGGLVARMFSSSYTPAVDAPGAVELRAATERLFERFAVGGEVAMTYRTRVYVGGW